MNDFFDAPTPEQFNDQQYLKFLKIDYSAGKTPAQYVGYNTPEKLADMESDAKLGFHYYDKDAAAKYVLRDKFTFAVLEVYAKITGFDGQYGYWSNPVKDSRTEPFKVYMQGIDRPIQTGLYSQIKGSLPAGVGFHLHFVAYCMELDKLVEIKLSANLQKGIERAMIASAAVVGKKIKSVNFFTLADNDVINGFAFTGTYTLLDKDGNDWTAGKDAFYSPNFLHGVISPTGKNVELHAKCAELQTQIRAQYKDQKNRASNAVQVDVPGITEPMQRTSEPFAGQASAPAAHPINTPIGTDDDLPF